MELPVAWAGKTSRLVTGPGLMPSVDTLTTLERGPTFELPSSALMAAQITSSGPKPVMFKLSGKPAG